MEKATDKQFEVMHQITSLREHADDLRNKWLDTGGWKHTSSTPGCYWMWRKAEFFCDTDTAERIHKIQCAEAYFSLHPELESD